MTAPRRDKAGSAFGDWIRSESRLDSIRERLCVLDTDYWVHQYRAHTDKVGDRMIDSIMAVELKTFEARLGFAQRDTLRLVAAGMRRAFYTKDGARVRTMRVTLGSETRYVRMYGYFMLRLQSDRPDQSEWIEWHGRQIDVDTLIAVLSFKADPRTLRVRSDRRHHLPSMRQAHPKLFGTQVA